MFVFNIPQLSAINWRKIWKFPNTKKKFYQTFDLEFQALCVLFQTVLDIEMCVWQMHKGDSYFSNFGNLIE